MKVKIKRIVTISMLCLFSVLFVFAATSCKKDKPDDSGIVDPAKEYWTVTIDLGDGRAPSTRQVEKGEKLTGVTEPTRTGYTFAGWKANGAAWTMDEAILADITIVAQWTQNVDPTKEYWTVTIDMDNGSTPITQKVEKGQKLTGVNEPTKEGYTFAGWKANGADWSMNEAITADITIVAQWTKNDVPVVKYTVTFDSLGGVMSDPEKVEVEEGKMVPIPAAPVKIGEEFIAWQTSNNRNFNFSTPITSDITLKALYDIDPKTYTIAFNTEGGSAVESITGLKRNEAGKAPENPTKEGYDFVGWYLDGKLYDFNSLVTKNITLTASWAKAKVTVTFDTGEGGSKVPNQVIEAGTKAINPGEPTKTDARFLGWYYEGSPYDFNTPVNSNLTLTAKWENTYTLTFLNPDASYTWQQVITIKIKENTALGENFSDAVLENSKNELSDLTSPDAGFSHNGYFVWDGWYVEGTDELFDPAAPVQSSMTIYAKWDEYYYVNFSNSNEGEIVLAKGTTVVDYYEELGTAIPTPTDAYGHPFDIWSYSGEEFDFNTPIVQNIVLTARYKYYVSFESVGGSSVEQQVIGYGKYAVEPENPTKAHYHFLGWYNSGAPFIFDANAITDDITITARWVYVFEGKGLENDPYLLSIKSDIENLSDLLNRDAQDPVTGMIYRDAYFKLTADIDMEEATIAPLAQFAGQFDGAGHSIYDFKLPTSNNASVGFFQELKSPAVVKNLKLLDVHVVGTHAANASIGLLAGKTEGVTITGIEVSGAIALDATRMERAVIGGLIGEAHQTTVYSTIVEVDIHGGNIVGGLVGYATDESSLSTNYVTANSNLQLYRTGYVAGLAGRLDENSSVSDSLTLANLLNSNYTLASDTQKNTIGFGDGSFVNCRSNINDKDLISWNSSDWNEDLTLKVIPDTHNQVTVSLGYMAGDKFVKTDEQQYDFGSKVTDLAPVEGESGTVFVEYRLNGSSFNENVAVYSDITLVAFYGSYESMLGEWGRTESEWFTLSIDEVSKTISAEASIFTDTYETTGSNFTVIPLFYERSAYETIPYVEYDSYGYYSLTGYSYEDVVIYLKRRAAVIGGKEEEYRVYLQHIDAGDYDKAFMRLERLESTGWELLNDLMYPKASDYSGYYLNGNDDVLFVKAPYIPNYNNYNQPISYNGTYQSSRITYTPFLFIGVEGYDEVVLGITTSATNVIGDYIVLDQGHLREIYNYELNTETNDNFYESFEFMNARWYSEDLAYDYLWDNYIDFNPKDPYYIYEGTVAMNHVVSVDIDTQTITVDGQTYSYSKNKNSEGVDVLSYQEGNKTHLLWADYDISGWTGITYFLHYQCLEENQDPVSETWVKYTVATHYDWVEDKPEEGEEDLGFGDIKVTEMTVKLGDHDPVPYDFVILTDCDGIPGMEVLSLTYLRFVVDDVTYFLREYKSVGFLMLFYEDPNNPNHLLDKRYTSSSSLEYYHNAYDGEWISKDQTEQISIDIEEKKINGYDFEYEWYTANDYDYDVMGLSARYYNRIISFTDGEDLYQFRVTFIRKGYGYLFKYDSAKDQYNLVKEYFGRFILDELVGTWNYYEATKVNVIDVEYDGSYSVYYNGVLQNAFLTWNGYNGVPVVAFKLDDGEKVELLHLVNSSAFGYKLMSVLDYDSYDAVYDDAEEDMVYEYTNKYLYFKDTTIADVVRQMSGTWTDGSITVTIKNDEILVTEPDFEPVTLSIAYIYDLPSSFMDQYVIIMVGIDASGYGNYYIYYYNYYVYFEHYIDDEHYTTGSLVQRDDVMSFRGSFVNVSLTESHSFYFDGITLTLDNHEYDVEYVNYGYARLNDGRIVPVITFDDILDLDATNLTAVLRACQVYYIDGVLVISITDSYVTLSVSAAGISIDSYDRIDNILVNELFYSSDVLQYNGVYTFNGTQNLVVNDGYVYVDGTKIDADILVLANGNIQLIFNVGEDTYYAMIGINAYGEKVYQIFKMSLAS
ncbi:MAG: InlB B-repeat-containing protein [Anaeroplasmataceae bacterium]|nr:InlB B-repeat-containing protein [Anaeroplasmataceae bacterium]